MDIKSSYNWLTQDLWAQVVQRTYSAKTWSYSGHSQTLQEARFWYCDLGQDPLFTETLFQQICRDTNQDWNLLKVYANGQTFGLSGAMHQDVMGGETGQYYTFLYYANPVWYPEWGGTTVFSNGEDLIVRYPAPNSVVLFDSTIPHVGLEPTRHCADLRVTVAWKLQKI